MITMIGVGVQYKGGVNMNITNETNLYHAFTAVTNIVFAYCAHVAFFGLIAEMEEPKDFPKALCLLQVFEICLYVVAAVVIYYYVGNDVTSPALGSAGPVLKKVAYGIAIPTVSAPPLHLAGTRANSRLDCRSGCREWTRRIEIHLRPPLPPIGAHAQPRLGVGGLLGRYWRVVLGDRLDHRRGHSDVYQYRELDCMC